MAKNKEDANTLKYPLKISVITDESEINALNDFFEANDLEISEEEPVKTGIIKAWKVENTETKKLVAGICLASRQGEYIIDGIAVDSSLRGKRIGEKLLAFATDEVKKRGGTEIYLVARAPKFFEKEGFEIISGDGAPFFYECATCPQYKVDCFPEIMRIRL